jgi:hypothetical protein
VPRRLADADLMSKSDPCVQVYTRLSPLSQWEWVGKTGARPRSSLGTEPRRVSPCSWALTRRRPAARAETVKNNLNPKFTTPVLVDFFLCVGHVFAAVACALTHAPYSLRCCSEEIIYIKFEVRAPRRRTR